MLEGLKIISNNISWQNKCKDEKTGSHESAGSDEDEEPVDVEGHDGLDGGDEDGGKTSVKGGTDQPEENPSTIEQGLQQVKTNIY